MIYCFLLKLVEWIDYDVVNWFMLIYFELIFVNDLIVCCVLLDGCVVLFNIVLMLCDVVGVGCMVMFDNVVDWVVCLCDMIGINMVGFDFDVLFV